MLRYWKEHNDESTEFLVNGAVLCCSRGSDYSTLDSADHGVYTDSSEVGALANTGDKKFDGFVSCSKWNEEPLVAKHSCRFKLGEWRNVRKNVSINGKYALDTNSYLPCKHGGIISPVTSGQEYTLSKSYNKYPKFLNDEINTLKVIKEKRAKSVVITSSLFSEISFLGDIVFRVPIQNNAFLNSYMVPMEFCNIVLTSLFEKNKEKIYEEWKKNSNIKKFLFVQEN